MKKTLTVLCLLSLPLICIAQSKVKEETKSKIELFSTQPDVLLKKEFIKIGNVKSVKIEVLKITNLQTNKIASGLRLEYEYKTGFALDTKIAFLDADEIEELSSALNKMKIAIADSAPSNYTVFIFQSRSGFEAGIYYDESAWKAFIRLEKNNPDSRIAMATDDFNELLFILQMAKGKL